MPLGDMLVTCKSHSGDGSLVRTMVHSFSALIDHGVRACVCVCVCVHVCVYHHFVCVAEVPDSCVPVQYML